MESILKLAYLTVRFNFFRFEISLNFLSFLGTVMTGDANSMSSGLHLPITISVIKIRFPALSSEVDLVVKHCCKEWNVE